MSFSLLAIVVVMIFTRATFYWTIFLFWIPLVLLFLFCCGMGLILSSMSVYFRDITHLYGVLLFAWMYMTPIFYDMSFLPESVQSVISLNPMYNYITFFRSLVVYGQFPGAELWGMCIAWSVAMLVIGMLIFKKLQRNFILYI